MRVTLRDNIAPQLGPLQDLGLTIVNLVNMRDSAIIEHNECDADFGFPDGNWKTASSFFLGYQLVSNMSWEVIRLLRQRSNSFTGYGLAKMGAGCTHELVVAMDYDDMPDDPPPTLVARWRELINGVPERFIYHPRAVLGEVGWRHDDILLNLDTVTYQERMSLMHHSGVLASLPRRPRILEIGGGYGAIAVAMMDAFPDCDYWICDLPEALLFSGLYARASGHKVGVLHAEHGQINLLPNYLFHIAQRDEVYKFDLAINTLSMSEMTPAQIAFYARALTRLLTDDGVLFEQNQDNRHLGLTHCKDHLAGIFNERRPVNAPFSNSHGIADIWRI